MDFEPVHRRSRRQLWLLIAVFFAPLATAFLLYYGFEDWRPSRSTNQGELLQPARALPVFELSTPEGTTLTNESLRGKWNLVYIGDGQCGQRCREALVLMRQSRLALNEDLPRVQRIFLTTGHCCDQHYLQSTHPGLIIAQSGTTGQPLLHAFPGAPAAEPEAGYIYIVDPLGNLMMRYSPEAPHKALLEDLEKLLKLSHIG
ncbi:hypothetical protein ACG33_15350 [Steroidobacter denitrificans]|uniref:Thioredoxin domain-containing protein n=2 Tax=Steroidobacter denitrificans TaxID=465721 RepID=A0A127FEU4_STEDE|nr:hypothetical protein ACG33_15350 [Steroidobacter denitrificans]